MVEELSRTVEGRGGKQRPRWLFISGKGVINNTVLLLFFELGLEDRYFCKGVPASQSPGDTRAKLLLLREGRETELIEILRVFGVNFTLDCRRISVYTYSRAVWTL